MSTAKDEAIAHMVRAVRGLEKAIDKLDAAFDYALVSEQRQIFKLLTLLDERLEMARAFLRHLKAAEVVVSAPEPGVYQALQNALTKLQAVEVETSGVSRVINVATALANTVKRTRKEVSSRAT